jgi:hypothetical protein
VHLSYRPAVQALAVQSLLSAEHLLASSRFFFQHLDQVRPARRACLVRVDRLDARRAWSSSPVLQASRLVEVEVLQASSLFPHGYTTTRRVKARPAPSLAAAAPAPARCGWCSWCGCWCGCGMGRNGHLDRSPRPGPAASGWYRLLAPSTLALLPGLPPVLRSPLASRGLPAYPGTPYQGSAFCSSESSGGVVRHWLKRMARPATTPKAGPARPAV